MPRHTEYALQTVDTRRHRISVQRTEHGWELTLWSAPVQPEIPDPVGTTSQFLKFIQDQSCPVLTERCSRFYVGDREVRPTEAALLMVRRVMGSDWTVRDLGKGYAVELRS